MVKWLSFRYHSGLRVILLETNHDFQDFSVFLYRMLDFLFLTLSELFLSNPTFTHHLIFPVTDCSLKVTMQLIEGPVVRIISLNTEMQASPKWNVAAVKQWTAILHESSGQWKRTLYLIIIAGEVLVDRMQLPKLENVQNTGVDIHALSSTISAGRGEKWDWYCTTLMCKSSDFVNVQNI